jgi:5-methylcytosine-specific restriction endonuclease McrA
LMLALIPSRCHPSVTHRIDGSELVPKKATKHRFRRSIIEAWANRCAYCDCEPEKITLDHVVPKVHGGTTVRANLVPACQRCNGRKGHTGWREWFRACAWYCSAREEKILEWLTLQEIHL